MTNPTFIPPPEFEPDEKEHRRKISRAVGTAMGGGLNVNLDVTLTANATSTTITDARLSYFRAAHFDPMTANASAEQGNGTIYITQANRLKGSFVVTHANNAQADRTFRVTIIG